MSYIKARDSFLFAANLFGMYIGSILFIEIMARFIALTYFRHKWLNFVLNDFIGDFISTYNKAATSG